MSPILLSLLTSWISPVMAATPAPASLPEVDFSRMGTVGLGGSFAGLDWWSSSSSSSSPSIPYSTDGDTIFLRNDNGTYRALGSTEAGGQVNSLCWSNTSSSGTLYIGGRFSAVSGVDSANIIAYSLDSSSFQAVSPGLSGPVIDLYCDNSRGQVWVGGSFTAPSGTGGNVALWSIGSSTWSAVDFGGLNGPVESISPSSNGNSVYFTGAFTTIYTSNSTTNSTITNTTSIPSAPNGTTTTGNSGYLTPATLPAVSSASGNFTVNVGPSTPQSKYSDPNVLLCPGGGGIWLARDQSVANVDLLGYNFWRATGVRIKNGLVEGRGTKTFCFTSLPDNTELNMTYTDPATGRNATCTSHCPLYTDPKIAAQDFVFTDGTRNMTGFQMQLKEWLGDGAGLSSVELLTDGAYGSATPEGNTGVCKSESPRSSAQTTGDWKTATAHSSIPATTTYYLTTTVSTTSNDRPSVTFFPQVSAAGFYDVYMLTPGCASVGDCDKRTSVDVQVFPQRDRTGWTGTISQQVQQDSKTLIYSGPLDMSSGAFKPSVVLRLAANPEKVSGNEYTVVASAVELVLTGLTGSNGAIVNSTASGNSTVTSTTNTTSINTTIASSYGVFEYIRAGPAVDALFQLGNTSETSLTRLGFTLNSALNTSSVQSSFSVNAIATSGNTSYVGGNFSSGNFSNILTIDTTNNQTASLPSQGLNGAVNAIVTIGSSVYFGGAFQSTASSGGPTLRYLAKYDAGSKAWSSVGGGVDGPITDMTASSSSLIVTGNFSHTLASDGTSTQSGGYAVWDTASSTWTSTGVLFGNVSTAAVNGGTTYMAGKIYGTSRNPANGIAMLSTGDNGLATISSISGVNFGTTGSSSSPSTSPSARKRSHKSVLTRSFLSRFTGVFATERAIVARAPAPVITTQPTIAPAVLAGAFCKNGSQSVTIMGGNFSTGSGSGEIGGLAFYANSLYGPTPPVSGVVRALEVIDNKLYIGGSGVNVAGIGSNLVVYDLTQNRWSSGSIPTLNPSTGSSVSVNVIQQRQNSNTVVLGGNFATAGALNCAALCLWDSGSSQWTTPGTGLASGEVKAIDFAGDNYNSLIAAGSFILSSTPDSNTYVAIYNFDNSSWTALDGLPGPALAVAVDDRNISNIFAAGYSTTDNSAYLRQWNGASWVAQNASLLSGSVVQQLAFVPLSQSHTGSGSIERDRMLMVSGNLYLDSGSSSSSNTRSNVTSALYDGTNWYPYLIGTSPTGTLASGSSLFWSESLFTFAIRSYLARGLVVLVAIAIATGLILLLILLFFLIAYCTRRTERKSEVNRRREGGMFEKEGSPMGSTHQTVFENVQAALEQSLGGRGRAGLAGAGVAGAAAGGEAGAAGARSSQGAGDRTRHSDPSSYHDIGAYYGSDRSDHSPRSSSDDEDGDDGEEGRETTMRYDFDGPELQPGEMAMKAGQKVVILDDTQSDEWFYARDPASGREGVVPATYVW